MPVIYSKKYIMRIDEVAGKRFDVNMPPLSSF